MYDKDTLSNDNSSALNRNTLHTQVDRLATHIATNKNANSTSFTKISN